MIVTPRQIVDLGQLERVNLRTIWAHEATDFTRWLHQQENLERLGNALGKRLEPEGAEVRVGPFRADILCREVDTGQRVLIENQLERSDHGHLGQLLTYAAGLEVAMVVWVAPWFTDEHRAAVDWLNRISTSEFSFFCVETQVWRIGNSQPALHFELVAKPNEWSRVTLAASRPSGAEEAGHNSYWSALKEFAQNYTLEPAIDLRPSVLPRFHIIRTISPHAKWILYRREGKETLEVQLWVTGPRLQRLHALLVDYVVQHEEQCGPFRQRKWKRQGAIYFPRMPAEVSTDDTPEEQFEWFLSKYQHCAVLLDAYVRTIDVALPEGEDILDAEPDFHDNEKGGRNADR